MHEKLFSRFRNLMEEPVLFKLNLKNLINKPTVIMYNNGEQIFKKNKKILKLSLQNSYRLTLKCVKGQV